MSLRAAVRRAAWVTAMIALASVIGTHGPARAAPGDDPLDRASVVFARGDALYRVDARGRGETKLVELPQGAKVRALRSDVYGRVLLADLDGTWWWMRLDGAARKLSPLPCDEGPAQLAVDAVCVLCRSKRSPTGSVIVQLATGKQTPVAVPAPGTRLTGEGSGRRLVWADERGVWSAPPRAPRRKQQVAAEAPLRFFLPSPDGSRATGVYLDKVFDSARKTSPAEVLVTFALDGVAARRKSIKNGIPIEWSHDNHWLLIQDRGSACIASAVGGQYKCWKGFTGSSISADGKWALLLGDPASSKPTKKPKRSKHKPRKAAPDPGGEPENAGGDDDEPIDDVEVAPPSGPLALYRAKLDGAFTEAPARIVGLVDGAAVWISSSP